MMGRASGKILAAVLVMLTTTSCNKALLPIEPTFMKISDETVRIEVQFESSDAEFIKNKEIYLNISSLECESGAHRLPVEAYVEEWAVSGFDFPIEAERTTFHGDVPAEFFSRYERPCLTLTGGSYLGRTVSSEPVPIEPKEQ